jgi:hypothetical protein
MDAMDPMVPRVVAGKATRLPRVLRYLAGRKKSLSR